MIIRAYLTAFRDGEVREVEIPDAEASGADDAALLELAYKYGQNDFQRRPQPSLSVGDVIELPSGARHRVSAFGFTLLAPGEDHLKRHSGWLT